MRFLRYHLLVLILLLVQAILLTILSWQTSLNRTEAGHVGAAVYLYKTFRFDVFHVNPPLTRAIVGVPILLTAPEYDWKSYSPRPQDRSEWGIGGSFLNANTPEKNRWCVFFARCSLIPIILLGSWFGYRFATELYGQTAGILFLILWTFSPLVLAWGATICPDVCAAALGIIGVYTFWHWLKKPTWGKTFIAGICLGLLPLTKMTWIIAFPLWILIWIIWVLPFYLSRKKTEEKSMLPGWKQLGTILLVAIYMINMGYGFDGSFRQLKEYKFISYTLSGNEPGEKASPSKNRFEKSWLGEIPVPLPSEFVQGIDTQKFDFEQGIESYFRGQYSEHGWWYYYAYTILIKEPLGILLLGLLTAVVSFILPQPQATSGSGSSQWSGSSNHLDGRSWRDEMVILLPGLVLFVFISSQTGFSLHPRYIILVLPFAYIWISKLGQSFVQKRYVISGITTVLLIWVTASSLLHFPHSMSYFNELIGGPKNGPKHLLGSNIDWGQNSYFLKTWYDTHPEARPIKIAYSSAESLEKLGIKGNQQPSKEPEPGWFVVGVNELYGSAREYEYFQRLEPVDHIGDSIYVYHISLEEANRVRHEMGLSETEENEGKKVTP